MRLKARFVHVLLYQITIVALACIVVGCGSTSAKLPTYMRPELLYLNHQPYSRLYVEVDTVEGVEVPDKWLDELKAFLETYCSKPEGIEIVQDPPVPLSEVKGLPIGAASILCLDGPNPSNGPQPAYFHIFFFDRNVGLKAEKGPPHVVGFCPCGILFNVGYFRVSKGKAEEFALKHELGHVLGLCKNSKHGDGAHCKKQACLMYKRPGVFSSLGLLLGSRVEKQLCADCISDLQTLKSEETDPDLSFEGPFWVRREDRYSVASLPYCDIVITAPVDKTFDWTDLLSFIKDTTHEQLRAFSDGNQKSRKRRWYMRGIWDGSVDKNDSLDSVTDDDVALLRKIADDPSLPVKSYAKSVLKQIEKEKKK